MDEALDAQRAGDLQQDGGALHVRLDGRCGLVDAPIHVRFRRKMNDRVAPAMAASTPGRIADIALHKANSSDRRRCPEIGEISGVGQLVEIDDLVALAQRQDAARTKCEPMNPAPPVTKIFTASRSSG